MITRKLAALFMVAATLLSACGSSSTITSSEALVQNGELVLFAPRNVSGPIGVTGSSTVYPLTLRMAREFRDAGSRAEIAIGVTGTGGGFRAFCGGAPVDIVNASRPITEKEIDACRTAGREPVGFPIGIDALAVVVSQNNPFLRSLSFEQLKQIFSGQARTWDQVDPSFPQVPIAVFSPGADSGTFDFFVDKVLDGDDKSILAIPGIVTSEDDEVLLKGIIADPYAIGYFGYAYYNGSRGRLRALAIDGGQGPVAPTKATAQNGRYPLARPLFIYSSEQILREKPQVAAFVSFYLRFAELQIDDVGYFPSSRTTAEQSRASLVAVLENAAAHRPAGRPEVKIGG